MDRKEEESGHVSLYTRRDRQGRRDGHRTPAKIFRSPEGQPGGWSGEEVWSVMGNLWWDLYRGEEVERREAKGFRRLDNGRNGH